MAQMHPCINHPKALSSTMCFQCHKPICRSCVVVMPQGQFCSTQCSALYANMKAQLAAARRPAPSKLVVAGGVIMFVLALTLAYHFAVGFLEQGELKENLVRFDVWETLLSSATEKAEKLKQERK